MPAFTVDERAAFDQTIYPSVGYLYVSQPTLVFEAPLNGVFYSNDGVVALDYGTPTTGAFGDIEPETTCEIWSNGANRHGSQRIRKAASADAIFVGRSPEGTRPGELSFVSGATIRVYKERRIWAKNPYIDPNSGNQYKDELVYPGDNDAQSPVANAGPDVLIISNTGNETISLDALGDIASFAVRSGASLSSYLWDLDDGSVDTGTLSSSSLTATFGYGERYVSLTVTDSNGATHTCYKYVVVARPTDCIPAKLTRESIRPNGVTLTLEIDAAQLPAAARPNAKMLYGVDTTHGGTGSMQLGFSGWLADENWKLQDARRQKRNITVNCHDVAARLRMLYGFPLTVSNQSSETGWYRMPDATIDRLTHHYLQWHTNALALADFSWSGQGATYPLPELTTQGASIWEQASRLARAIGYRLTCSTRGALRVLGDPFILPTSDQATEFNLSLQRTATEVTALTDADYGEYNFTANQATRYFWVRSSAVVASAVVGNIGAVKCSAPGKTPAQGTSSTEETELLVTTQDELNVRAGNDYATRKNPAFSPFNFEMVKTKPLFEPSDMEWLRITLPSEERTRYPFLSASGNRFLISEIVNTYDHRKFKRKSTLTVEIEVEGIPAQTVVDEPQQTEQFETYQWQSDYVPIVPDSSFDNPPSGLTQGTGNIALMLDDGTIAVTNNFSNPSWEGGPSWTIHDHSATLGSSVVAYSFRAGATNISAWLLTPTKIIYGTNLQGATPTFSTQHTFAYTSALRGIDSDFLFAPGLFAVVVTQDPVANETKEIHTTDGGSTWSTEQSIGSSVNENTAPTVKVSSAVAGKVFLAGVHDASSVHYLHVSSNFGGSYAENTNVFDDNSMLPGFTHVPFDESVIFHGYGNNTASPARPGFENGRWLFRGSLSSSSITDISPVVDGDSYGPAFTKATVLGIADNDANKLAMIAWVSFGGNYGVFVTSTALATSPTWVTQVAPGASVPYRGIELVNNGAELYAYGINGNIAYSNTPYTPGSLDDRTGDLVTSAEVIGIAGF